MQAIHICATSKNLQENSRSLNLFIQKTQRQIMFGGHL